MIYETTEKGDATRVPTSMVGGLGPSARIMGLALAGSKVFRPSGEMERMESPEGPLLARSAV